MTLDGYPEPHAFAGRLTADLVRSCGAKLIASYLHGSAALGGWIAERSDVDLLLIAADDLGGDLVTACGEVILAAGPDCPGRGLEVSLVTAGHAVQPAAPWPFLLHSGLRTDGQRLYAGTEVPGDPDLIMHYEVCRTAGVTLLGPPPAECVGPIARPVILRYLAGELDWGLANGTENYAVLNACRAEEFAASGRIVAKVTGGATALERGFGPAALIRQALSQQRGFTPERQPGPEAIEFVREVRARLEAAAGPPGG